MRHVKIFVSSPGDAHFERGRLSRVVERLNGEFRDVAKLETIRWETEFYKAHDTFQAQIPEAATCDMVIAIFRARLGTELPETFERMDDGTPYPSGTAYEVLSAIASHRKQGFPDVYVFRYPEPPLVKLEDPQRLAIEQQWGKLKTFFETWFTTATGQFRAALQTFGSTDDFEVQIESLLRKWLEENVLHGRSVLWPADLKGSPFRGLAAFGVKHAAVFFGRTRDTAKAIDRLKDAADKGCPFLLLNGASGAGKSSLARAGIVARLTAPGVAPSVDIWRVAVMRVGEVPGDPFASLARRLFDREQDLPEEDKGRPAALPELANTDFNTPDEVATLFGHADAVAIRPLFGALDTVGRAARDKEGYQRDVRAALLLVVDQLDDLFNADISEDVRTRFAKLLAALAKSGRVWIVATLRADLYERFLREPLLRELKEAGASYDLAPPEAAELAEIVRGPAEAADLTYETDKATGERLDERLLKDADRPDLLPLLQFTLNQLFETRDKRDSQTFLTFAAYQRLGGLEGAVDKEAERALASVDEAARSRLPRLLRQLAVPARDTGAGPRQTTLEIQSVPLTEAAHDEPSTRLVRALVDARILLSAGEASEATVRFAHARVLTNWQRASKIAAENAEFYRIRGEVEAQRRRWEAAGKSRDLLISSGLPLAEAETIVRGFKDEIPATTIDYVRLSGSRARLKQRLVAAAAVVFACVAGVAGWQWVVAERNAKIAEHERARAQANFVAARQTVDSLLFNMVEGFQNVEGLRADSIRKVLEAVQATIDRLAQSSPDDTDLQHSRFAMFAQFGRIYAKLGDSASAQKAYEESLVVIRKLLARDPTNMLWQRDESLAIEGLAELKIANGDIAGAMQDYERALAIARSLVARDGTKVDLQRDLFVTLKHLGDLQSLRGDYQASLKLHEEALVVMRGLLAREPENTQFQRDLGVALASVGDMQIALGNGAEALKAYEESLELARKLVAADPGNTQWLRDLGVTLQQLGDLKKALGDSEGALQTQQESLVISRRLVARDDSNTGWQRDLVVSLNKIGDLKLAAKDSAGALVFYDEALIVIRRLSARDPSSAQWQRDTAVTLNKIGDAKMLTDRDGAAAAYREGVEIVRRLVALDRTNVERLTDLIVGLWKTAFTVNTPGEMQALLQEALQIITELEARGALRAEQKGWRNLLETQLARLSELTKPQQ